MKILFYASSPLQHIGYSRVANVLSNYLVTNGHEVFYFSVGVDSDEVKRFVEPSIKMIPVHPQLLGFRRAKGLPDAVEDYFGVDMFEEAVKQVEPEIVLVYNDIIVVNRIINQLMNIPKTYKLVVYLDLVYEYEKSFLVDAIEKAVDQLIVFSNCWREHLMTIGYKKDIQVLKNGFTECEPIPNAKTMLGFKEDDFIVLNCNRNSYRKGLDLTVEAFLRFLKMNDCDPKIKIFLNCSFQEKNGYDIHNLFKVECLQLNLDYEKVMNQHVYKPLKILSEEMMHLLYEACDIGINTCLGEGFGLCNIEHGAKGKPQIVSNVGGLKDNFEKIKTVVEPVAEIYIPTIMDFHGGIGKVCRAEDFSKKLNQLYHDKELYELMSVNTKNFIQKNFKWKSILDSWKL
jgi:glycosyltransferase involved in cell wall biosynthesis